MPKNIFVLVWLAICLVINLQLSTCHAQGTAFTYQGQLQINGLPANGSFDFLFVLFPTNTGGTAIAGVTDTGVSVSNGLFTTTIDFGPSAFTGGNRWLGIEVRTNGLGIFSLLAPREQILPTPYSIMAETAMSANGLPGLTLLQNTNNAPDIIGGSSINSVSSGVVGATIGGGGATNYFGASYVNSVTGDFGTIGGGYGNTVDIGSTIAGGEDCTASGGGSAVGGGYLNHATGGGATIAGGSVNEAYGQLSTIAGGYENEAFGTGAFIGGGGYNGTTVAYNYAGGNASVVGGGIANAADGAESTISGGESNEVSYLVDTVGGGQNNVADGGASMVGGGSFNTAEGSYSFVGGGQKNTAFGVFSAVGGGTSNGANNQSATVSGGDDNDAGGLDSTIGGGEQNNATNDLTTVSGGVFNTASGYGATVGGGDDNKASGTYATVPGGIANLATGTNSFAAGADAEALFPGDFVWADNSGSIYSSTAANQFDVRASGGIIFAGDVTLSGGAAYHNLSLSGGNSTGYLYGSYPALGDGVHLGYNYYYDANGTGHVINAGGATSRITVGYGFFGVYVGGVDGAPSTQELVVNSSGCTGVFNNSSDRNLKQNFAPVSSSKILDEVMRLPVSEWSYKQDPKTRHVGPMAQDFYSVFNVGSDDKHIATIDEGGVALAAIQGLNQKLNEKDAEIQRLKQQNELLEKRLDSLTEVVNSINKIK